MGVGRRVRLEGSLLAAVCVGVPLIDLFGHHHVPDPAAGAPVVLLVLIAGASLLVRRRFPVTVALLGGGCGVTVAILGFRSPLAALAAAVALYSVGVAGRRIRSVAVAVLASGVIVIMGYLIEGEAPVSLDALAHVALAVSPVFVGELVRMRRATVALLLERADLAVQIERDAHRLRVEQERRRIARDLHDVVGHALTTINVQAGVAAHLLETRPEFAREALHEISAASGEALRDVRSLVGVLREPDQGDAPVDPEPGLNDVAALVERSRRMGIDVGLSVRSGPPDDVPRSVQVAGYRIVQESLTNVGKHAGGVRALVEVEVDGQQARIRVWNADGRPSAPSPAGAGPLASPAGAGPPALPAGAGLAGMRERAASVGGSLDAGPCPDGGFEVRACLPLRPGPSLRSIT